MNFYYEITDKKSLRIVSRTKMSKKAAELALKEAKRDISEFSDCTDAKVIKADKNVIVNIVRSNIDLACFDV